MKLSIIIPCFNESKNIPILVEKLAPVITREIDIILVNNGSTDDTEDVFKFLSSKYKFLKFVHLKKNIGYGNGIVSGLKVVDSKFLGYTHADLQTDPEDILKALEILKKNNFNENIYIKGLRKGRPLFDNFFTIGMSVFESIYMSTKLWDINAQPNVFSKSFFMKIIHDCPDDFSLDLYLYYKAKKYGLKIKRFDVLFPRRIFGKSSWNNGILSKWKFIKRTINFSFYLKKNLND